jgi:PAS domain-containing protein
MTPERVEALLGFAPSEFDGSFEALSSRLHVDDEPELRAAWTGTVATHDSMERQFRVVSPDGGVRWIDARITDSHQDDGRAGRLVGVMQDVTAFRAAAAASSELAAIVESSTDAIISKDLDGIVTSWNSGAERIFGFTACEMIGCSMLRLIPVDCQDEERQILARVARGERVPTPDQAAGHNPRLRHDFTDPVGRRPGCWRVEDCTRHRGTEGPRSSDGARVPDIQRPQSHQ